MPFVLKKYNIKEKKKIQLFLLSDVGLTMSMSQKLLAKKRVFDENGEYLSNGQMIKGKYIKIALFEGITKGLKPIFNTEDFAIFDKPSGIMVHPTSRITKYTLLDEIRYHFGESANLSHRIDVETSGLVLVSKHKYSDIILKTMFENKKYIKEYAAIVRGFIKEQITINKPISKSNGIIGVKMTTENIIGKESITIIEPVKYYKEKNITLIKAIPITGRQHQIRVHLNSIGHTILGDPIYGVNEIIADEYLCKRLTNEKRLKYTNATRLMLHAENLTFKYKNRTYNIWSRAKFNSY